MNKPILLSKYGPTVQRSSRSIFYLVSKLNGNISTFAVLMVTFWVVQQWNALGFQTYFMVKKDKSLLSKK